MVLVNNRELKDRSFFEGTEDKRQNYNVRFLPRFFKGKCLKSNVPFPGRIFLIFGRQGQLKI